MTDSAELQLRRWINKAKKLFKKDIVDKRLLTTLGNEVADRIRTRTRLGYGVPGNNLDRRKLVDMRRHSQPYAEWRANNSGELSSLTAPKKHNLTLTGHMLNSLKVLNINASTASVNLGFSNSFAEMKARVNDKRGWRFLYLSKPEVKGLYNFYNREVRKLVKQFNNR